MSHVEGRIFWDPALPESTREERAGVYDSMNEALARLHAIDVAAAGLSDYGKPGNYFRAAVAALERAISRERDRARSPR